MSYIAKRIREWNYLEVGRDGNPPTRKQIDLLHKQAVRLGRQLRLSNPESDVLLHLGSKLKAGQTVGIISTPGLTLEILPKIDGGDDQSRQLLVRMISITHNLKVTSGELAQLTTQRHALLEILIRLFIKRLNDTIRRGLPRRYKTFEDDLFVLRGKLNIRNQIVYGNAQPGRFSCRFDELSEDTPLNRVLKAATALLLRVSHFGENIKRLHAVLDKFDAVSDSQQPLDERVVLDRTNFAFHDLYRWACLFLNGIYQSTTAGKVEGIALLFPMNDLFEEYIGKNIRMALKKSGNYKVNLQHFEKSALRDLEKGKIFRLKPDVWIHSNGGPDTIVLDTKWKALKPKQNRRTLEIQESDIYQMLAYAQAYNPSRLILLYPWSASYGEDSGIVKKWETTGTETRFYVATVNIYCDPREVQKQLHNIVMSNNC